MAPRRPLPAPLEAAVDAFAEAVFKARYEEDPKVRHRAVLYRRNIRSSIEALARRGLKVDHVLEEVLNE
jgi:hypothetical protein